MTVADFGRYGPVLDANSVRISSAFASGIRPPPRIDVSDWAKKYRKFGDDAPHPGDYDPTRAKYLKEIHDRCSPHDPAPVVSVIKCGQSGGSVTGENFIGYVSDVAPGPMMYVGPTISAAKDWLAEKFWPMVEASPRLNPARGGSIMPKRQRDGAGTTALRVRFRKGGWMLIAGANSAATLRQHSIRYVIEDDLDQFPDDLDNQGSPEGMVTTRLTTFTKQGTAKRLKISTPTNKGASKIGSAYAASDRCRYYFKCCHCGARFDPTFEDLDWPEGRPDQAVLKPPCCSEPIAEWAKEQISTEDGWCPTNETADDFGELATPPRVMAEQEFQAWRKRNRLGRHPGYHITGIISAFLSFADLCLLFVEARGDVNKLRAWTNLQLGEEFVLKGDAPPAEDLKVLREQDWGKGQVPWGPSVFTLGCDVQGDGIYFEAVGWGHGLENWGLDHGFLPGPTDNPGEGAWARLEEYAKRTFVLPGGRTYGFDQICVDASYHTDAAKAFCRRSPKRLPVYGREGWTLPILGRGQAIHFMPGQKPKGRQKKKAGDEAHLVGTYGAKYSWFGFLRASIAHGQAVLGGGVVEPIRGQIHFGRDATDDYFDQLTSESCVVEVKKGQPRRVWKVEPGRENHWLDCRVYNRAAAEALTLDSRSEADWLALQAVRYAAADPIQGDLIALANRPHAEAAPVARPAPPQSADAPDAAPANAAAEDDWVGADEGWL